MPINIGLDFKFIFDIMLNKKIHFVIYIEFIKKSRKTNRLLNFKKIMTYTYMHMQ